jgi:RNA polymerase sigma-70 factor (ECF subfamily)
MNDSKEKDGLSVEALRSGDRAEFTRLVELYSAQIYRLGMKMLSNPQDAEDILQETFIKAFRYLKSFDGRSSVATWLYRIATNEALMQLRRKHPEQISIDEPLQTLEGEQEPIQIVDWCCVPEGELLSAEGREILDRAVDTLPAGLRIVFLLRDIEGLDTRETGEVLEISEMAVKTRLSRARMKLREELSGYYAERLEGQKNGKAR